MQGSKKIFIISIIAILLPLIIFIIFKSYRSPSVDEWRLFFLRWKSFPTYDIESISNWTTRSMNNINLSIVQYFINGDNILDILKGLAVFICGVVQMFSTPLVIVYKALEYIFQLVYFIVNNGFLYWFNN